MSNEEIEAIWYCFSILSESENSFKRWKIIENYIQKLHKEIEELEQTNANLSKEIKLMKSVNINENFIGKDKIRNKIEELEDVLDLAENDSKFANYKN